MKTTRLFNKLLSSFSSIGKILSEGHRCSHCAGPFRAMKDLGCKDLLGSHKGFRAFGLGSGFKDFVQQ